MLSRKKQKKKNMKNTDKCPFKTQIFSTTTSIASKFARNEQGKQMSECQRLIEILLKNHNKKDTKTIT